VQRNALAGKRFRSWEHLNAWLLEWATTVEIELGDRHQRVSVDWPLFADSGLHRRVMAIRLDSLSAYARLLRTGRVTAAQASHLNTLIHEPLTPAQRERREGLVAT
jgi:hypothetical protein